jgi:lysophospholipase L1-like esterase
VYACVGPDGGGSSTTSFTTLKDAAVSLGDSYISGEAGRWQGNSDDPAASRDGTDRACSPSISTCTSYDKSKVYLGGSDTNGCHRSDVAEILSASLPVQDQVNLACSGAVTPNIFRASNGGQSQDGLPPQADQLAPLARSERVKLIVLSIGGNDLGFASIVQACVTAYLSHTGPCNPAQQANLDAKFPAMSAGVDKAIREIRATMSDAGYASSDYRLVVQSYPSVAPRASENRYAEIDPQRAAVGGCPFYDADFNWARDSVVFQISAHLRYIAAAEGVQFLELGNALQGHEICSKSDSLATPTNPPSPSTSEWGRFINQSTPSQGDLQESFHPNAYAQQALGRCLTLLWSHPTGSWECDDVPGQAPSAMTLKSG